MATREEALASADAPERAAQAFYARAAAQAQPFPVAQAAEPASTPAAAPASASEPQPVEAPRTAEERAADLYGPSAPTRGYVDWAEPAAQARDYDLTAPAGVLDTSEAGQAAMTRLRDGFAEAGAGKTLAAELFQDAVRSRDGGFFPVSREMAERDLRQHYGRRYEAQLTAAKGLIQQVAQRCPEIISFLERSRLGDNPEFIRKVVAAAAVARRRGSGRL